LSGSSQTSCCASSGKSRHPAEAHRKRAAPTGAAAGAAEFEPDLREFGRAVFISAKAFGLHQAEHARIAQRRHGLGRNAFGFLGRERPGTDLGCQFANPAEDVGEIGPRRRPVLSDGARGFHLHFFPPTNCNERYGTQSAPLPPV
jgi:hypothetical protein